MEVMVNIENLLFQPYYYCEIEVDVEGVYKLYLFQSRDIIRFQIIDMSCFFTLLHHENIF